MTNRMIATGLPLEMDLDNGPIVSQIAPSETPEQMRERHRRELDRLATESRTCPRCGHVTDD